MNTLGNLQRWSLGKVTDSPGAEEPELGGAARAVRRRFALYRALIRLSSLGAAVALALWLKWPRRGSLPPRRAHELTQIGKKMGPSPCQLALKFISLLWKAFTEHALRRDPLPGEPNATNTNPLARHGMRP